MGKFRVQASSSLRRSNYSRYLVTYKIVRNVSFLDICLPSHDVGPPALVWEVNPLLNCKNKDTHLPGRGALTLRGRDYF